MKETFEEWCKSIDGDQVNLNGKINKYFMAVLKQAWDHQQDKIKDAIEVISSIAHNGYEDENGRHEIYPEQLAQEFLDRIKKSKE